jgi:hypothetical protein
MEHTYEILKTGFSGLIQTNVALPCPWGTNCKELKVETPLTFMADNFLYFPQETSSVICDCSCYRLIAENGILIFIGSNQSERLISTIDTIVASPFLLSAVRLTALSYCSGPLKLLKEFPAAKQ